jgi:hypothetical protein
VPISHEIPKTTLDSLLQIRGGYNKKIEEAVAQNDASKKRRLERLMKVKRRNKKTNSLT